MQDRPDDSSKPLRAQVPASSINILVVDDNQANRSAFRTLLERLGYDVFLASSGDEALALATRHRFAVILLDVRMPVMDGIDTALLIKRKPFNRTAPIIFVSAHQATAEQVSRVSLEGLIGYVHSPVDSELLVWKVKNYVEHYLKNEEIRLQSALVWQACQQHRRRLESDPNLPADIRQSAERLADWLEGLKNLLSDRLGIWADEEDVKQG